MPTEREVCDCCGSGARKNANLHACFFCKSILHSVCGSVLHTREDGSQVRACPCRPEVAPRSKKDPELKTSSLSDVAGKPQRLTRQQSSSAPSSRATTPIGGTTAATASSTTASTSTAKTATASIATSTTAKTTTTTTPTAKLVSSPNNSSPKAVPSDRDILNMIIARLDTIDNKLAVVENLDSKLKNIQEQVAILPKLRETVEQHSVMLGEHTAQLENLTQEQEELRQLFNNSESVSDDVRLSKVETATDLHTVEIDSIKLKLTGGQPSHASFNYITPPSSQLIISGLAVPDSPNINLRRITYAVLKPLYADLELHDILFARKMTNVNRTDINGSSTHFQQQDQEQQQQQLHQQQEEQRTPLQHKKLKPSAPPPIVATLSTPQLVPTIISGKIHIGTLHTSQISTEHLVSAGVCTPLASANLSINEMLAPDKYKLWKWVRGKAIDKKTKSKNFIFYKRKGCIFVKKTKDSTPLEITHPEDLTSFLEVPSS